jgi:lysophospholipid acyltransferase (LPLAT)-like uncharacterized protein
MKLRQPWLIGLVALVAAVVIKLWMATVRYKLRPADPRHNPLDPRFAGRYVYAFWHEAILGIAGQPWPLKVAILISQHADGELIARVCRHLRVGVVRGSTTRGGATALRELLRVGSAIHLAVTPDGPRGPRRRVQLGVVFLAAQLGLPVVPVGVAYRHCWRARSWDRFAVPWPGTLAECVTTEPVTVPVDADRATLEKYRDLVEQRLVAAQEQAEALAGH